MTGYNGIFNVTKINNKFNFTVSIQDDNFNQITTPPGAYEIESLTNEIKRIISEETYFTGANYPFAIKSTFSTFDSIIKIKSNFIGCQNSFVHDDSIRDLLGFNSGTNYEK